MAKAVLPLGLVLFLVGPAFAADQGWHWTWGGTQGTGPYVYHFADSKILRPVFAAGRLRHFEVHLEDGHGEPFYEVAVDIRGNQASAGVLELDQDARPERHFTGTFSRKGNQDVITLQSAEGERIVLTGNPPSR